MSGHYLQCREVTVMRITKIDEHGALPLRLDNGGWLRLITGWLNRITWPNPHFSSISFSMADMTAWSGELTSSLLGASIPNG